MSAAIASMERDTALESKGCSAGPITGSSRPEEKRSSVGRCTKRGGGVPILRFWWGAGGGARARRQSKVNASQLQTQTQQLPGSGKKKETSIANRPQKETPTEEKPRVTKQSKTHSRQTIEQGAPERKNSKADLCKEGRGG